MSVEDKIDARIEAAFSDKKNNPDSNGNRTERINIRSHGIDEDDLGEHELVKDVIEDDGIFRLCVRADSGIYITKT